LEREFPNTNFEIRKTLLTFQLNASVKTSAKPSLRTNGWDMAFSPKELLLEPLGF